MTILYNTLYFKMFICAAALIGIFIQRIRRDKDTSPRAMTTWTWMLFFYLTFAAIISLTYGDAVRFEVTMLALFISAFIYQGILVLAINRLRKYCSAGTCVELWNLMSILYIFINGSLIDMDVFMGNPVWIIPVPARIAMVIGVIWGAGFVVSILFAVIQHIVFSRELSRGAVKITGEASAYDKRLLEIYKEENRGFKEKVKIMYSEFTASPVTVGVMGCVLYMSVREYSEEELRLIFRHELTHIANSDNQTKLLIAFFNSIYWFMPVMRKSSRMVAEDIELGCDEQVLVKADDKTRMLYANLILHAGSDCRGFSTCLSATGECIRYRLGRIVHPHFYRKSIDILAMTIALVLLIGGTGLIQISTNYGTGSRMIFGSDSVNLTVLDDDNYDSVDETDLESYLNSETIYETASDELFGIGSCRVLVDVDGTRYILAFDDRNLYVNKYWEDWEDYLDDNDCTRYKLRDSGWKDKIMK